MDGRYLLLGAGFSRTWGGLLASEVFGHLLSDRTIRERTGLTELLKKHDRDRSGYEGALSEIQDRAQRGDAMAKVDLMVFQAAVRKIFLAMNAHLIALPGIDIGNSVAASMRNFLNRFDAIFTLNQDILLERHYAAREVQNPGNRAVILPGIKPPHQQLTTLEPQRWLTEQWTVEDASPNVTAARNEQPLFKLHGSSNWRRSDNQDLLIMGGQKMKAVRESTVLTWYHDEFARRLAAPGARLMTIGYGFQDQHVNEPIYKTPNLPIFVVDPAGLQIGLAPRDRQPGGIPVPNPLEQKNIIGLSTRMLNTTFAADALERQQLETFFE